MPQPFDILADIRTSHSPEAGMRLIGLQTRPRLCLTSSETFGMLRRNQFDVGAGIESQQSIVSAAGSVHAAVFRYEADIRERTLPRCQVLAADTGMIHAQSLRDQRR